MEHMSALAAVQWVKKNMKFFLKSFRTDRKIFLERSSMFDGVKWAVNLSERRSWPSLYLFHIRSAFLCVFLKKVIFFFFSPLYSQNLFIVFEWPRISFCVCVTENDRNINCGSGRKHKQQLLFFSNMHAKFPVVLSSSCGMHTFVKTHSLSLKSILAALKWSFMSYLSACVYVIDLGSRRKSLKKKKKVSDLNLADLSFEVILCMTGWLF